MRKPTFENVPETTRVCSLPREQIRIDNLSEQILNEGFEVQRKSLNQEIWQLEHPDVLKVLDKLTIDSEPLVNYAGSKPLFGIKTGLNQAFLIDSATRASLISSDESCTDLIRPYLRGQDLKRWHPKWSDFWIILLKSSTNTTWPWSHAAGSKAEQIFQRTYPSIFAWMKQKETHLKKRSDKGVFWWELRSCAYYEIFEQPKIMWQDISYHSKFCLGPAGLVSEATCFSLPSSDSWLLAVLNSSLLWFWLWRNTIHAKDEALRLKNIYTEKIPIVRPSDTQRSQVDQRVQSLVASIKESYRTTSDILDWLRVEYEIDKPSKKLQTITDLDSNALVAEVKKLRGKKNTLSVVALRSLRDEYTRTIEPARIQAAEALNLERQISDLVNEAYGLTPDEVALMWKTAPPRMPIPKSR